MSAETLVRAEGVSMHRQGKAILKEVSMEVAPNDFVTVVGPNGAGKSMLLKVLLGLCRADKGKVSSKRGLRFGYLPQRLTPDPAIPITAGGFLRLRKRATEEECGSVAAETGVAGVLSHPLHALSGGELQRLLLARSLLGEPDLLVLDEPAQNLDISGQLAFYRLLERLHSERGLSVLMVSHDLHVVMASTRRVVCLYHHVCCAGKPQAVARHPEFVSLFGGDFSQMMAFYQHQHNHTHEGADDA